jgi:secretion/DNA translocation related TadE-like protein
VTPSDERGTATIVMLAVLALGVLLAFAAARAGAAAVAGARADSAADAAALAAADMLALSRGPDAAARAARETARDNGAELVDCTCEGRFVSVWVVVHVPVLGAMARSTARAEVRSECALGC